MDMKILFLNSYVSTRSDECNSVGVLISTHLQTAGLIFIEYREEIVSAYGNIG